MLSIGTNIIRGLINGITSMGSNLGSTLTNVVSGAVNKAKAFLGIHSPSTLFEEIGQFSVMGLEEGWQNEMPKAEKAIVDSLGFMDESLVNTPNISSSVNTTAKTSPTQVGVGDTIVIPVYIGNTRIEEIVIDSQTLANYRSGGR